MMKISGIGWALIVTLCCVCIATAQKWTVMQHACRRIAFARHPHIVICQHQKPSRTARSSNAQPQNRHQIRENSEGKGQQAASLNTQRKRHRVEPDPERVQNCFRQQKFSRSMENYLRLNDDQSLYSELPLVFPFQEIVVFGDSLSSTEGNQFVSGALPAPNHPYYFGKRLTDGPVWHEYLQKMADTQYRLGWKYPTKVKNYARPWSSVLPPKKAASPEEDRYTVLSLTDQVKAYLDTDDFPKIITGLDPHTGKPVPKRRRLFVVWMGGNDVIKNRRVNAQTVMDQVGRSVTALLKRDPHASVLIPSTLPGEMLPFTPKSPLVVKVVTKKMNELRVAQQAFVMDLKSQYPRNRFYFVDTMNLIRHVSENLMEFELADTLKPCLTQISTGKPLIQQSSIKWNSMMSYDDYFGDIALDEDCLRQSRLFVDGVHVSSAMHRFMAELILAKLGNREYF